MLRKLVRSGVSFSGRERNCSFVNLQDGTFSNASVASGLDLPDDGRGVATVDWDHDGDLDLWIVNRNAPQVRYMQNELPRDSHFVSLKLTGTKSNRDAIGARVELRLKGESQSQIQTVRAGGSYLSQSSKRVHFGTGTNNQIEFVKVQWPSSEEQTFQGLAVDSRYELLEGRSKPLATKPAKVSSGVAIESASNPSSASQRVLLTSPLSLPRLFGRNLDDTKIDLVQPGNSATLVNLWATWCQPCIEELDQLQTKYSDLQTAGIAVLALSVDEADLSHSDPSTNTALDAAKAKYSFEIAKADSVLLDQLQIAHDSLLDLHQPLPIPSSVLLDKDGNLIAIYKGAIGFEQILLDANFFNLTSTQRREKASPFAGKWSSAPRTPRLINVVLDLLDRTDLATMIEYVNRNRSELRQDTAYAVLLFNVGQQHSRRGEHQKAVELYKQAIEKKPTLASAYFNLGVTYAGTRQYETALVCFQRANLHEPNQLDTRLALARTLTNLNRAEEAVIVLNETTDMHPNAGALKFNLAIALASSGKLEAALNQYQKTVQASNPAERKRYDARFKKAIDNKLEKLDESESVIIENRLRTMGFK